MSVKIVPKITRKMAKQNKDIYRGYIPPGLPQNRPRNPIKPWWKVLGKPRLTMYPDPETEEFSREPEYPPIRDSTKKGRKRQVRLDWYESIKALPTVDQKLYEVAHHCRHHTANIYNWLPTYRSLPFVKFLTQTHVINSLPIEYAVPRQHTQPETSSFKILVDGDLTDKIRQIILDQVKIARYEGRTKEGRFYVSRPARDKNYRSFESNRFIENLVNQMRKVVAYEKNPQLLEYHLDLSPAIKSWWFHSGFEAPNNKVFFRSRKDDDGNINQLFQLNGSAALNIRSEFMMEPILDKNDPNVTDTSLVEKCNYNPRYYGAQYAFKWPVALPGFWFEDKPRYDNPHTSFLSTDCLNLRRSLPKNLAMRLSDDEDCLTCQAILTAFGWLNSIAMYHGYTPFQQIDYPLTCQVVTTDGQDWLFNVYQFNSSSFHRDLEGPRLNNVCWSSGIMKLFESFEDGKFSDVNDDVIHLLVKFFSKQTDSEYTDQLNLRPYLSEDLRSQEEKEQMHMKLRNLFEQRYNRWLANDWAVPDFEHIFFRSRVARHQTRHMKPKFHIPKPVPPNIFE